MATATTRSPGLSKSNSFTPITTTLADGDEVVVVLQGVSLPRSIAISPVSGDTVRIRQKYSSSGAWFDHGTFTSASAVTDLQQRLIGPVYAIGITRTIGAGTTSVVEIA